MIGTIQWHHSKLVDMGKSLDGLEIIMLMNGREDRLRSRMESTFKNNYELS